jgi:hypothetical protein
MPEVMGEAGESPGERVPQAYESRKGKSTLAGPHPGNAAAKDGDRLTASGQPV